MSQLTRVRSTLVMAIVAVVATSGAALAQMSAPNTYRAVQGVWGKLPEGRTWGATSAVYPSPDGRTIWVGERCGENNCFGKDNVPSILQFDRDGNLLKSFGAGMILWPHGMFVDYYGNVWVTDAVGFGQEADHRGHSILKFSPDGELLMTLGTPGTAGEGQNTFRQPSDLLVAPNGDIFVADGHGAGGNNRIVKLSSRGTYIKEWGSTGAEAGEFRDPHALAMDSQGRLFVGDRGNSRIQIFDQEGEHLATWTQFGRPSGLFIDENDILYSADSESNTRRHPGWRRGVYIGSVRNGWVTAFIADPEQDPDNSGTSAAEGIAVDGQGNVYGAEVGPRMLRKYVKR